MPEVYVSTDIEANGPIPGPYSMLSMGSAAFLADGSDLGTFEVNLDLLPSDKGGHPETMAWWRSQPREIWEACRKDPVEPVLAMSRYTSWLDYLGKQGTLVFVGYPATFDFMFVYWYLINFTGKSPFGFQALDMKSYAAAVMKCDFKKAAKGNMPKRWFDGLPPHTHRAIDDAIEQGKLFLNIRQDCLAST